MIILIALAGLLAGTLMNHLIARQLASGSKPRTSADFAAPGWIPIVSSLRARAWTALAVELITALIAAALFYRYGVSVRTLVLFGASLVLINTGAIDFKTRMIDTLVMVVATGALLLLAPLNDIGWLSSALGVVLAGVMFIFLYLLAGLLFRSAAVPFGLGDVYLAAFIGALVGFVALPAALFYGMAMAGVVAAVMLLLRARGRAVPQYIAYGTYLCLGTLLFLATSSF